MTIFHGRSDRPFRLELKMATKISKAELLAKEQAQKKVLVIIQYYDDDTYCYYLISGVLRIERRFHFTPSNNNKQQSNINAPTDWNCQACVAAVLCSAVQKGASTRVIEMLQRLRPHTFSSLDRLAYLYASPVTNKQLES